MYLDSLDIANRALQHCEQTPILSTTEDSRKNLEMAFAYDKVRRAEMRRNVWRFSIRKVVLHALDVNTMLLQPAAYSATATYLTFSIVVDANNQFWYSTVENNFNNAPGGNNDAWMPYFGPLTIEPYDTSGSTAYWSGELVYMPGANPGSYVIYQSLENANADVPNVATPWSATTQFNGNAVVSYSGSQWSSNLEINLNVTPAVGPLPYDPNAVYSANQTVTASDQFIYSSVGDGNTGNNPVTDGGVHWTNTGVPNGWMQLPAGTNVASTNWRIVNATMTNLTLTYPIGAGPTSQASSRNVFRLPAGYLREAPQDPKQGATSILGAPSALAYDDWEYSGNYIVTDDTGPLLFRFVADMSKVSDFDDLFCEGLACTMALAAVGSLTQSAEKKAEILVDYKRIMGDARTVNSIEIGPVEQPEDDWVTCRL